MFVGPLCQFWESERSFAMNPCTNDWVKLRGKINYGDIYEKT